MAKNTSLTTQVGAELATRTLETQWQRVEGMTTHSHLRVFPVQAPATVFVRGTRCTVNVQYHALDQVEIHVKLYNAFGLRFVTEQDEAGVYVVVKRRRLLGMISRSEFLLKVPDYAHLAFKLTPGAIHLDQVYGMLEIPTMNAKPPQMMIDKRI